ncbi:MAG: aminoacyl-tRNA hydrolase [Candidatus Saccharibacteria bacterium]|nr:aminoacyl-tRNA hydrolase [Candidatus Saccharibacteria bacterium]
MKLVVGLGNPGAEYNFTRHNFGFLALDFYFRLNDLSWGDKPRYGAITGRRDDILFIKPQNYYNESGSAVSEFARYYKVQTSDILVLCDNFDLEFGKIRARVNGTAGGNNGLKSVTKALGTDRYPRIRLGTGNDELKRRLGDTEFVLSRFTAEEKERLPEILGEVAQKIDEFCGR